jgi:hypothetical protein
VSVTTATSVQLARLRRGEELANGGFGTVYDVLGHPLSTYRGELVYKEIKQGIALKDRKASIRSYTFAVQYRQDLADVYRQRLDSATVWPLALVVDNSVVCGCLMPKLPKEYFYAELQGLGTRLHDRALANLSRPHAAALKMGLDPDDWDFGTRLQILANLANAVATLHELDLVYGDLSGKNAVFRTSPSQVLLLDCDSTAHVQDASRRQGHTPFWTPPEHEQDPARQQDKRSDVYKLGLAVVRALTSGQGATQLRSVTDRHRAVLLPETVALIERALDRDPDARPTSREIADQLHRDANFLAQPPAIERADLSRRRALRNQDVEVTWTIRSRAPLTSLRLQVPDADGGSRMIDVQPRTADRHSFSLRGGGTVVVEAENRYGRATNVLGLVECIELPPFDLSLATLPLTEVPRLPRLALPAVLSRSVAVPRLSVPEVPRLAGLDTPALIEGLAQLRATAPGAPAAPDEAVRESGHARLLREVESARANLHKALNAVVSERFDRAREDIADAVDREIDNYARQGMATVATKGRAVP